MPNRSGEESVVPKLSSQEALVLFEWLAAHAGTLPIDDPSEQEVLWRIEGAIERALVTPLLPDYKAAVASARLAVLRSPRPT